MKGQVQKKFENSKKVFRICKSKECRHHNGQKKKNKGKNKGVQT